MIWSILWVILIISNLWMIIFIHIPALMRRGSTLGSWVLIGLSHAAIIMCSVELGKVLLSFSI